MHFSNCLRCGTPLRAVIGSGYLGSILLFLAPFSALSANGEPDIIAPSDLVAQSRFGYAVAMSGNVLVSATADGPVYVYRHNGAAWALEQKIEGYYSHAIAVDDTVLALGGDSAQIYRFNGSSWLFEQSIAARGFELDIDGDTLAMADGEGPAEVYRRSNGAWAHMQTLGSGGSGSTRVSVSGDVVAVGAAPTVSLYRYNGSAWQIETTLNFGFPPTGKGGLPVSLDGNHLGVLSVDSSQERVVQLYEHGSTGWSLQEELLPPGNQNDVFRDGSLALEGDLLAVGNPLDRGGQGSAWVYRNCGGDWGIERSLAGPSLHASFFGISVGLGSDRVAIGAPFEPLSIATGSVYAFANGSDCNENAIYDGCERLDQPGVDCDGDVILDVCESNADCNLNGAHDRCDLAFAQSTDCNENMVPDECDIASGDSIDGDGDEIPDECLILTCEDPQGQALYSLKAARINSQRIPPSNEVQISPGDVLDMEIFASCWGSGIDVVQTFETSLLVREGATSGTAGTLLPVGWDAPLENDRCPCDMPPYLSCTLVGNCSTPGHDPEQGAFVSVTRSDFILQGFSGPVAVSVGFLESFHFAGTAVLGGAADKGLARYLATLKIRASGNACGTFEFDFDPVPAYNFLSDDQPAPRYVFPRFESLQIHVCEDDGLFCNGLETCDAQVGCQIIPPPNCDDGVACTADSCDEGANGCAHAFNHTACDDGDECTSDECTSSGCVNIDDQCGAIPAASHWGLTVLAICLLIAAKIRFRPRAA